MLVSEGIFLLSHRGQHPLEVPVPVPHVLPALFLCLDRFGCGDERLVAPLSSGSDACHRRLGIGPRLEDAASCPLGQLSAHMVRQIW